MIKITFITGNQGKADFLAKYLGHRVEYKNVETEEIQSLDLEEIASYKAKQAYDVIKAPVLVEDAGLVIYSMGKLPGPFIKWFHHEIGLDNICRLVDTLGDRKATAMVCFAYYDGQSYKFFKGFINGRIADKSKGSNGFGFDPIFIPNGSRKTLSEMDDEELGKYSLRTTTVYPKIKKFLTGIDNR